MPRLPALARARRTNRQSFNAARRTQIDVRNAPVKGWLLSENVANLPKDGATVMDNWYPEPDSIRLRPGSQVHARLPAPFELDALNTTPRPMWTDGVTLYVADESPTEKVFAYDFTTGARDADKDFDLDALNSDPSGIWSDGTTAYIVDFIDDKVFAYVLATGARDAAKDFGLDVTHTVPRGIHSDGITAWIIDNVNDKFFAYVLATGARDAAKDFDLDVANTTPTDVYSDGTTIWVADFSDDLLYAYTLSTGARSAGDDIALAAGNSSVWGIASNGKVLWANDFTISDVFLYDLESGESLAGGANAETVMPYQAGGQTNLFAAANGTIYDVTTSVIDPVFFNQTIDRYQYVNFATAGGQFLLACNGAEHPINYNGSTWSTAPAISGTGLDPTDLVHVISYNERLFFIERDSANVWYLPVVSVGGVAERINVGPQLREGGSLVAGSTWTIAGADSTEDYLVFVSSEGEVIMYSGINPADANDFRRVGRFKIGRPIGRHCMLNLGTDLAVLTSDGLVSLARSAVTDRTASDRAAFTDNIDKAFVDAFRLTGDVHGWQIQNYPTLNMAIINVPIVAGVSSHQYVMNVLTGAWARFLGMNAFHWVKLRDDIYFAGTEGKVHVFDRGSDDDGVDIIAETIGAYDDMKAPGLIKHVVSAQAFFQSDVQVSIGIGFAADFKPPAPVSTVRSTEAGASNELIWDQGRWDVNVWGAEQSPVSIGRFAGNVVGHRIAPVITATSGTLAGASLADVRFNSLNILYEVGDPVG